MQYWIDGSTGRVHICKEPTITHEEKLAKLARKKKMKAVKKARKKNRGKP